MYRSAEDSCKAPCAFCLKGRNKECTIFLYYCSPCITISNLPSAARGGGGNGGGRDIRENLRHWLYTVYTYTQTMAQGVALGSGVLRSPCLTVKYGASQYHSQSQIRFS